jgi:TPR repeat protein
MLQKFIPLIAFLIIGANAVLFRHEIGGLIGLHATGPEATYRQGLAYTNAATPDYAKSMSLFLEAAKADYAPAEREIGVQYEEGQGVKPDPAKALAWYQLAAEQGDGRAEAALIGVSMHIGTNMDLAGMVQWLTLCAQTADVGTDCTRILSKFESKMKTPSTEADFAEGRRRAAAWKPRAQGSKTPNL